MPTPEMSYQGQRGAPWMKLLEPPTERATVYSPTEAQRVAAQIRQLTEEIRELRAAIERHIADNTSSTLITGREAMEIFKTLK